MLRQTKLSNKLKEIKVSSAHQAMSWQWDAAVDEIKSILRKIYIQATPFLATLVALQSTIYAAESRGHLVGRVLILA